MEITSVPLLFIASISIFIFYIISPVYRVFYLTLLSSAFVLTFGFNLLIYVFIYAFINYILGLSISVSGYKKTLFRTGIIFNLAQLILLKYSFFAIDPVLKIIIPGIDITKISAIIIPVGISYFTLQGIGYLINVKMGWERPERRFLNFFLYFIFYPKYISGPVERSTHFLQQLDLVHSFNGARITEGLRLILLGLFKKIVIANQLIAIVNTVYSDLDSFGNLDLWIVLLIQPLSLYFDFSGYTDMAIGLARTYGINLLPNFNNPFLSENVTTFWKRFHSSLSSWFNDYIFKQISFKYRRWGRYAAVFAVFLTFTLFGIWHGAGWNFMLLGFMQACALNYEFFTKQKRIALFSKFPGIVKKWTGRTFTYLFFAGSLVLFFSPDIHSAFKFYSELFNFNIKVHGYFGVPSGMIILALFLAAIFLVYEVIETDYAQNGLILNRIWNKRRFLRLGIYYLSIGVIIYCWQGTQQFIYSQF